jgi:hypothetical protein
MLKYDANYVIFGGDLNTDISRNTPHTTSLLEFVSEYDMGLCVEMQHADVPYTYLCERDNVTYTSKVDHFVVSNICVIMLLNVLLLMNSYQIILL